MLKSALYAACPPQGRQATPQDGGIPINPARIAGFRRTLNRPNSSGQRTTLPPFVRTKLFKNGFFPLDP
jgi:hypothetical protein